MTGFLIAAAILVAVTLLLLLPSLLRQRAPGADASRNAINAGIYPVGLAPEQEGAAIGELELGRRMAGAHAKGRFGFAEAEVALPALLQFLSE